jgi:FAD/FMN-containing dehydrogenase
MRVIKSDGKEGSLDAATVDGLSQSFRGRVVRAGEADYDDARRVWNAAVDKKPAIIARCAGVADVMAAVRFAREHDLMLAVRGGGHNVAGSCLAEGGLVVDLGRMTSVRIDPTRKTARAETGATWKILDGETQELGLAVTGGAVSSTGIAGYTLGGGIGWLARSLGLACDNVLSADVVTADGRLLTASAEDNKDLFWAIRGGGANFGVVTSLEYRLHPVSTVLAGLILYPYAAARDVLRWYRDHSAKAPDQLSLYAVLLELPDAGKVAVIGACYNGDVAQGEKALGELRRIGTPVADLVKPTPYRAVQQQLDGGYPAGHYHYWKAGFLKSLDDATLDALLDAYERRPLPSCHMLIEQLGGAVARVPVDATAYAHRDSHYSLSFLGVSADAAGYSKATEWARQSFDAFKPLFKDAVYVNYVAGDESDRARNAYGPKTFERLAAVKRVYDPKNTFRTNVNVPPA